jgi:uncharacterized damage-inducible protein DinB
MTEVPSLMDTFFQGWQNHQSLLIAALQPLSSQQLALRAAPESRTIAQITTHIVSGRAKWFLHLLKEGGDEFAALSHWERSDALQHSAADLIQGLETTWHGMQSAWTGWSSMDWQQAYTEGHPYAPTLITRQWVIWHLLEHDLHHGGEISLTLGMHGIAGLVV